MEDESNYETLIMHKRTDDNNGGHSHFRKRSFTDEDINALVSAIAQHDTLFHKSCRFNNLDPEILEEASEFYRKFNSMMDESGKIIWKTVLVAGIGGLIFIIGLGVTSKIKQILEP